MNEIKDVKDLEQGLEEVPKEDRQDCTLMNSMIQKINGLHGKPGEAKKFTIFRVPKKVRKSKARLFEPAVISIGPYHRQSRPHLSAMEEMKWQILRDILNGDHNLGACTRAIKNLEVQARMCYSETIGMNSDSFVEMMVLDGCFILEYLFDLSGYNSNPVHYAGWSSEMISHDLILMENQIPFFILETLYHNFTGHNLVEKSSQIYNFLTGKAKLTSTKVPPPPKEIDHLLHPPPPKEIDHLLHLCYYYTVADMLAHESQIKPEKKSHHLSEKAQHRIRSIITKSQNPSTANGPHNPDLVASALWIPCVTELREAGVRFRKKGPKCHFMDVTFQSGVLEIPSLQINDQLAPHLMNLIVLEQCKPLQAPRLISSYVAFMDAIVNTTKDVIKLQRKGIIDNMLSSEKEVALLFNQTGQDVTLTEDHFFAGMFKEVNKYCALKKHRYGSKLRHNYFNNPWSILSLLGAIILLLLTFMQTFYAAFAYHHPPPSH